MSVRQRVREPKDEETSLSTHEGESELPDIAKLTGPLGEGALVLPHHVSQCDMTNTVIVPRSRSEP